MFKKLLLSGAAVCVIGGVAFGLSSLNSAEKKTLELLYNIGFLQVDLPEPESNFVSLFYRDVPLDPDAFSSIEKLIVTHDLLQNLQAIDLYGFTLSGEYFDGEATISGFDTRQFPYSLGGFPVDHLHIKDGTLSVLTEHLSGISVTYETQMTRKDEGLEFQIRLTTDQKPLSFSGNGSAFVGADGWWFEGDLERGKFDLPQFFARAARIHGHFKLTGAPGVSRQFVSELNAGGGRILGVPWQNMAATIEHDGEALKIFTTGRSLGDEPVELSLNIAKADGEDHAKITGTLYAARYDVLKAFLEEHGQGAVLRAEAAGANDITLAFAYDPAQTEEDVIIAIKGEVGANDALFTTRYTLAKSEIEFGNEDVGSP